MLHFEFLGLAGGRFGGWPSRGGLEVATSVANWHPLRLATQTDHDLASWDVNLALAGSSQGSLKANLDADWLILGFCGSQGVDLDPGLPSRGGLDVVIFVALQSDRLL